MTKRDPPITEWSANGLVDEISKLNDTMNDRCLAFILGAGASVTSGIPAANTLAKEWIKEIHMRQCLEMESDVESWAAKELGDPDFRIDQSASLYSKIFELRFGGDPHSGYAALESKMENAEPSLGYSILAKILAGTRHRVVITTNFDNLIADALAIHALKSPLIVGHESLAGFVRPFLARPLVAKIHRDLLLHPKNDPTEVDNLEAGWKDSLTSLFQHYTPLVIGYGGNDGSLMGLLESLPNGHIPGRLFWCYREGERPNSSILKVVAKHNGVIVPIAGFDEFMLQLAKILFPSFDIFQIVEEIKDIGNRRAANYDRQANTLLEGLARDSAPHTLTTVKARESISEVSHDLSKWWNWELRAQGETDNAKKSIIYQDALKHLPNSAELLGNYASFLAEQLKEYDTAETLFKRALELDPTNAVHTGNYAYFLAHDRNKYDAAEALYKRALELDPGRENITINYANFLIDKRKDYDAAEALLKRALELNPNRANIVSNYANFLAEQRKDCDAAEALFKRALELAPNDAGIMVNYANFLVHHRNNYDSAEALFSRALELDPNDASTVGDYAILAHLRKDDDTAEALYKRALELDPEHAVHTGNYASFLADQRGDYTAAEDKFKLALELEPNDANNISNYANFLARRRKDYSAAEALYKQALELEPNDARTIGHYANLAHIRKEHKAAETLYKRAVELEPDNAVHTGDYANLLAHQRNGFDAAETLFNQALKVDPNNAHNAVNFASLLLAKGSQVDLNRAKELVSRVINGESNEPSQVLAEALFFDSLISELTKGSVGKSVSRLKRLFELGYERQISDFSFLLDARLPEVAEERRGFYTALGVAILDASKVNDLEQFSLWNEI